MQFYKILSMIEKRDEEPSVSDHKNTLAYVCAYAAA